MNIYIHPNFRAQTIHPSIIQASHFIPSPGYLPMYLFTHPLIYILMHLSHHPSTYPPIHTLHILSSIRPSLPPPLLSSFHPYLPINFSPLQTSDIPSVKSATQSPLPHLPISLLPTVFPFHLPSLPPSVGIFVMFTEC